MQTWQTTALIAVGSVTALAAINLVRGSSQRARMHFDLARQFIELEKALIKTEPSDENLAEMTEKRLTIEMGEPPVLRVLDALCYNEQVRAMGYSAEHHAKIGWFQRQMAPFFDWRSDSMIPPGKS